MYVSNIQEIRQDIANQAEKLQFNGDLVKCEIKNLRKKKSDMTDNVRKKEW